MHEQSGDIAMNDMVARYLLERERRSAGEEFLPWWPQQLASFDQAVFDLADAVFGHPDWGGLRLSHERAIVVRSRCSERIADLLRQGHSRSTSAATARLERAAALAVRRHSALSLRAFVWVGRHRQIAALLARLGALGRLQGSVVVDLDGRKRQVTPEAWSSAENWARYRQSGKFNAGDERLSPEGTLCIPTTVVAAWCDLVRGQAGRDLAIAEAILCAAKMPEQSWKRWLSLQGWAWDRRITRREAAAFAATAFPNADPVELARVAKTIETTINRDLPSNRKRTQANTRQLH